MTRPGRVVPVRLNARDEQRLLERAKRAGKPLSTYLRDAALSDPCERCGGTGVEPVPRREQ